MASYPPPFSWQSATRYVTAGLVTAALVLSLWWIGRLANHVESLRVDIGRLGVLLASIERDVLLVQSKVDIISTLSSENGRRLSTVEDRVTRGSEDRQALQATDHEMIEALINLRAIVDDARDDVGVPPGSPAFSADPKTPKIRAQPRR